MPSLGNPQGCCENPQRQSQVVEQMEKLDAAVTKLENVSSDLLVRIQPLLLSEPPIEGVKGMAEVELVPHADYLRTSNRRLSMVVANLANALGRLEL